MTKESYVMVIIATSNQEEAEKIGKTLVEEKRKSSSANIIPLIKSFFFWKGEFHNISESIVIYNPEVKSL